MCLESYRVFGWGGQWPQAPTVSAGNRIHKFKLTSWPSLTWVILENQLIFQWVFNATTRHKSGGFGFHMAPPPSPAFDISGLKEMHLQEMHCPGTEEGNLISTKNTSSTWIVKKSLRSFEDLWTQNQRKKIHQGHVMFLWANWYGYVPADSLPPPLIQGVLGGGVHGVAGNVLQKSHPFKCGKKMGNRISSVW